MKKEKFKYIFLSILFVLLFSGTVPGSTTEAEEGLDDLQLQKQWVGDFDDMVKRRVIRVLVVPNKMLYFLDQGRQRGVNVDLF